MMSFLSVGWKLAGIEYNIKLSSHIIPSQDAYGLNQMWYWSKTSSEHTDIQR